MRSAGFHFRVLWMWLAWVLASGGVLAAPAQAGPERIHVGAFVNNISELDLKTGTFLVDFYLWFRWTGRLGPDSFEVMNGSDVSKEKIYASNENGTNYVVYRCQARLNGRFNFTAYPLDQHTLSIDIEDSAHSAKELVYEADVANSKRQPGMELSGWEMGNLRCRTLEWVYPTNYGDPALPANYQEPYSRFRVSVPIRHAGLGIYLKTFLPLFISAAIAFLSVFIPTTQLDARLGLGVAAVFGAVSSQVLTAQSLPETPHFTLADKLHLITYFFIFLALAISALAFYLHEKKGAEEAARRYDQVSRIALPAAFCVATLVVSLLR